MLLYFLLPSSGYRSSCRHKVNSHAISVQHDTGHLWISRSCGNVCCCRLLWVCERIKYCKHRNFNSDLQPHNDSYNSDSKETAIKVVTIFSIVIYVIYKLEKNH